jgi:phosphatidylinositol glycan class M
MWLFNPLAINMCTRGSADVLVILLLLLMLHHLLENRITHAAIFYGLAVHFRMFPVIYAPVLLIYSGFINFESVDSKATFSTTTGKRFCLWNVRTWLDWLGVGNRLKFSIISALTFTILAIVCYHMYGFDFLFETYLFHFSRQDPRHNFSSYFYHLYLNPTATTNNISMDALAVDSKALSRSHMLLNTFCQQFLKYVPSSMAHQFAFLPQMILIIFFSIKFAHDLPACMFVCTLAFVAFNKVCTAQYFIWWIGLLPLLLPFTAANTPTYARSGYLGKTVIAMSIIGVWILSEAHWLFWAFNLEFLGSQVFLEVWMASIVFLCANVFLLMLFIAYHPFLEWKLEKP